MLHFNATIQRFDKKGEKTGWHFVEISAIQAKKLKDGKTSMPSGRRAFRVKGTIDALTIQKTALIPMGNGDFILPLNATLRKAIGKKHGDKITLNLELDERKLILSPDLISCLKEDPAALQFFKSLPPSHQQYYSKWIESAKTSATKAKRIAMSMEGFGKKQGYGEMMRAYKNRLD